MTRGRRTASSREVADVLGVSTATVQLYARAGKIPFSVTPGGHRRFEVAEVQAALIPAGELDDVSTELLGLHERGLRFGETVPARQVLATYESLHGARPEERPMPGASPFSPSTALGELLSHARHVTLATVGR